MRLNSALAVMVVLVSMFSLAGCDKTASVVSVPAESDLIGTYEVMAKNGHSQYVIRISKENGQFFLARKTGGNSWLQKWPMASVSHEQLEQAFEHKINYSLEGISNNNAGIFMKVPKGVQVSDLKAESGFVLFNGLFYELHKL